MGRHVKVQLPSVGGDTEWLLWRRRLRFTLLLTPPNGSIYIRARGVAIHRAVSLLVIRPCPALAHTQPQSLHLCREPRRSSGSASPNWKASVSPSFAGVASETQQTAWQAIACRNGGLSTRNGYIDCSSTQKSRERHWIVAATTPLAAKVHSTTHAPSALLQWTKKRNYWLTPTANYRRTPPSASHSLPRPLTRQQFDRLLQSLFQSYVPSKLRFSCVILHYIYFSLPPGCRPYDDA